MAKEAPIPIPKNAPPRRAISRLGLSPQREQFPRNLMIREMLYIRERTQTECKRDTDTEYANEEQQNTTQLNE